MNKFIKIIILSLLGSYCTFAQVLENYESNFKTLFDKKEKLNPYYFGHNPAWLGSEVSDQILYLKTEVNDESGDFRKFTDPGDIRNYTLSATGKKLIDSTQIFRGSFSFKRTENNNWQWLFTRDYSSGSPFLIGDSTTGNTRLNGILMNVEYAARIFERFDLGCSINYYVDDGLKLAHPRPTSKDREINFSTGLAYHFTDKMSFGFQASVYDNVENIYYSQDLGSLLTEIILIKFRGYDNPNIFRMTSETRYSYNNGYSGGLNFLFEQNSEFILTAFANGGFNKINVKDGGTQPITEGLWKNNTFKAGLASLYKLNNSTFVSLLYTFTADNDWAEFPDFDVLYSKNKSSEHAVTAGAEYSISNDLSAGLEAGIKYSTNNIKDYYSNIFANSNAFKYLFNLGFKIKWSDKFASFISAGFNSNSTGDNNIEYSGSSEYFTLNRIKDLYYSQTGYDEYLFNFITAYSPGFGGEFLINLNFSNAISINSIPFSNQNRLNSTFALEYRVAAY